MKKLFLLLALALAGCNQQDTIAALAATLGHSVAMLVTLQGNPDLAAKLQNDTNVAVNAIRAWQPGTSAADAIRLLNIVIQDIQSLSLPEKYKPFLVLALGTAASILDILHGNPSPETRLTKPPSNEKEYKQLWDDIRASNPQMEQIPVL